MAQDLRTLFKNQEEEARPAMQEGHQSRFEERLNKAFPDQKDAEQDTRGGHTFLWLKIAAVLIVIFGVAFFLNSRGNSPLTEETPEFVEETAPEEKTKQLSDFSPEYKKVEDYYLASINVELAQLEVTPENKALIDSFMEQLAGLDAEYRKLNKEIAQTGVNESSVAALIENLRLRLDLLFKLKEKLIELKSTPAVDNTINRI
ncbi:hypothetical protein [Croceiramulus getboli]|nr:hypothetical protein P8624_08295 [Flavobacteriaceae bacterium YJPT1-3]